MNMPPNRHLFLVSAGVALLLTIVLVGCELAASPASSQPTAVVLPTNTPAPPTATPLPRGGNLTVRLAEDVPSLRPWQPRSRSEEQINELLYNGLMRLDNKLQPQPDLAQSWQTTPDGRLITFTLRTNLTWHDGKQLDAQDVRFTLDSMRSLPFTSTALLADLQRIAAVGTPTSSTVVLSLTERFAPLLSELTLPILPRHLLEGKNLDQVNFWDVPVGSGPFKLAERKAGESIVLSRFDGFHRGAPLLDRVAFVVAPDPAVAIDALKNGQLLMAELPWSSARSISGTIAGLRTDTYPENGYYFLGFNLREGRPFADVRVRQALALAIDVPQLVELATKGQGQAIGSSAVPGSWADLTPISGTVDLERARALLDGAGWTLPPNGTIRQHDGITLTAQLFVRGDDDRRAVAAQRIAENAATIGIDIRVQRADFASVIVSKYAPPYDFDLLLGSWSNGVGDPTYADYAYYDPDDFGLFDSSQVNQGAADKRLTRNVVAFSDSVYDNQAPAARQLYDLEQRKAAYRQTQARIAALLPYLFLWDDRLPVALSTKVNTLDGPIDLTSPMYLWNVERWYLR